MGITEQNFQEIEETCLSEGVLFEDPTFPATNKSIYFENASLAQDVTWKRPQEIVDNPEFFVEGNSRFDVKQGALGNCWLVSAVANLTMNEQQFKNVVPVNQSFSEDYCGVFYFRFWQFGEWVTVVIDDRLPVNQWNQLKFMKSETKNEFWSALLEKAYAKLHGTYEHLVSGWAKDALEDFTGGLSETIDLIKDPPTDLIKIIGKASEKSALMACSLGGRTEVVEGDGPMGLIQGHAYSITGVSVIETDDGQVPLLRIRNPWGNEKEWTGPWSDGSPEWNRVSEEVKADLEVSKNADGEFWMGFEDFKEYFGDLEITNLGPDSFDNEDEDCCPKTWSGTIYQGSWRGTKAGGCMNNMDSFVKNPQYTFEVVDPDPDDDEEKCTVIINLMQKHRRAQKLNNASIGIVIYKVDDPENEKTPFSKEFFLGRKRVAYASYTRSRAVTLRTKLLPGSYVIVPSTFSPGEHADYILRIFSEKATEMSKGYESEECSDEESGEEENEEEDAD